jgi:hypothetical protein
MKYATYRIAMSCMMSLFLLISWVIACEEDPSEWNDTYKYNLLIAILVVVTENCCILEYDAHLSLRTTGFLDFVHRAEFQILENTTFRKLDLVPSSGERRETPTLLVSLDRANLKHWINFGLCVNVITKYGFRRNRSTTDQIFLLITTGFLDYVHRPEF